MDLFKIAEEFETLKMSEKRELIRGYAEYVIFNDDIDLWRAKIEEVFGPPAKPEGVKPDEEQEKMTSEYGGIYKTQVLYKKDFDHHILLVMLWPWGDRQHTTVKVAELVK